ncbi:MAG: hypothetical protein GW789_13435, partial [Ignavibacteria bacterium]|nr:hypothetical protein [Ignavibacteria bacterium]
MKRSGILSLRLLYRKAQEYFEIENYFEVKRIKSTMANLDSLLLSNPNLLTWKDILLTNPNYMNFSALFYKSTSGNLICYGNNFIIDGGKKNIITKDFNVYYNTLHISLSPYAHLIIPISTYNFSGSLLPILFLNVILIDKGLTKRKIINIVRNLHLYFKDYSEKYFVEKIYQQTLKTSIISILVDSYAHNISAHSLAALKWWIELRYKMLDKRFYVDETKGLTLKNLQPGEIKVTQDLLKDTTEKYYETLGLTDSKYNKNFFSLFDYLQFAPPNELSKIFAYSESDEDLCCKDNVGIVSNISKKEKKENYVKPKCFYPRFPVPLDYALFPFLRFLRDKGAFWSGVTRDTAFGGESKSWYQILWEDFANNPLYLGTIAKSEGITKININLAVKKDKNWLKGRFVTIDLSIIDYEEKLFQDPNQKGNHENLSQNEIKKEDCTFTEGCGIDYSKYSKYALVKLGGCFKTFRDELSKEDYTVFLPGGVIGEHALFTIFENTLRNIKHYKDEKKLGNIRENGIDFWISIEKDELKLNDGGKRDDKKPPELFKVSLWLEHNTELIKCDDKENLKECLWKKVTDSSLNPILDDNGSPKMGGNSQDKACAAMLFNNKFISVESKEGKRDTDYYPWVHFTTTISNKHYDPSYDQP